MTGGVPRNVGVGNESLLVGDSSCVERGVVALGEAFSRDAGDAAANSSLMLGGGLRGDACELQLICSSIYRLVELQVCKFLRVVFV